MNAINKAVRAPCMYTGFCEWIKLVILGIRESHFSGKSALQILVMVGASKALYMMLKGGLRKVKEGGKKWKAYEVLN